MEIYGISLLLEKHGVATDPMYAEIPRHSLKYHDLALYVPLETQHMGVY